MIAHEAAPARYALPNLRQMIVGIDRQVPLLDGTLCQYVFLDNAASTPALRPVQEKVDELLAWYSSVHRGYGLKSLITTRAYDQARALVAEFVGADPQADCVIFGKNTSEAINKLANRLDLRADDVVISTQMEHHSNDLPWRPKAQVEYVGLLPDGSLDIADLERKLVRWAGRVRLVTTTGAANVTGFTPPIYDMAELAHRHGAMILVDCAQLAPHRAIHMGVPGSLRRLDFVAISGHKMYAPYGAGALIGPREIFSRSGPDYRGGGTVEVVTQDEVYWADPPERDEVGSPNVLGAVAIAAAIRVLQRVGMETIARHEAELTRYALERLNRLPDLTIYGSCDPERVADRLGVISFTMSGVPHNKLAAILGFEYGIGVRSGCFCAHPYVIRLLKVDRATMDARKREALAHDRSGLPGMVRASFGCYNTVEEVDLLVDALERISRGEYRGDYVIDRPSGSYLPRGYDPETLSQYFSL